MACTLENRSRTAQTFNLTLGIAPIRRLHARAQRGPDGVVRVADRRMVYPDSITLLAGEKRPGLPSQIVNAPEIANAISRGVLRHSEDAAVAPVVATPVTSVSVEKPVVEAGESSEKRARHR